MIDMTDKIFEQIMEARKSRVCNMLSTVEVQRYTNDNQMYDLVIFIEENKREYCEFILRGKRPNAD